MQTLLYLIVGGVIGALASVITKNDLPLGWVGNIVAGLLGSWLGLLIFGEIGPVIGGLYILPSLIGAVIFVAITSFLVKPR